MKLELQYQLFMKYPKILFKDLSTQFPIDQRGIECDDGWYSLIDKTCEEVQYLIDKSQDNKKFFSRKNVISQVRFLQVKEKFGLLRIYYSPTNNRISDIINFAENLSASVCEICGTSVNVTQNEKGWIRSLCESCHQKV
jgi:hypothetical protein